MKTLDPQHADCAGSRDDATPTLHESEVYLEHRLALDATLFVSPSAALVTYELDGGSLSLVPGSIEGDRPRK